MATSAFVLLLVQFVTANVIRDQSQPRTQIQWGPCEPGFVGKTDVCGTLDVPLDYTDNSSDKTLTLELLKVPALHQPPIGTVLFNFGGPGGDGRHNLDLAASEAQNRVGPSFDLVAFDPRGTGNTLNFSCYANTTQARLAAASTPMLTTNSSDVASGRLWADAKNYADTCQTYGKGKGDLLGTAFVARDFMQVVDALGGDRLLRYYGISYGTALGQTIAAMFPDRIDRMVLDGVLNPHEYYKGYDYGEYASSDETFSAILSECVKAGPAACALAKNNSTAEQLEASIVALFDDIKYNPIPISGSVIDYALVKTFLFSESGLYFASNYPLLMTLLEGLLSKNYTLLETSNPTSMAASAGMNDAFPSIKCSDKIPRTALLKDFEPVIDQFQATSKLFGDTGNNIQIECAQWEFEAKERYEGDFDVQTRRPILFVSNTYDPVTSILSARNASATFAGSALLEQVGFGHTSVSQDSNCTFRATQAYFENGTLPAPGTKCAVNKPLFG